MTPTTLAEALIMPVHQTRWSNDDPDYNIDRNATQRAGRIAAALLALPSDRRAALAAELLDVETLAAAILSIWPHHTEGSGSYPPSPSDYSTQVPDPFGGRPDAAAILAALERSP